MHSPQQLGLGFDPADPSPVPPAAPAPARPRAQPKAAPPALAPAAASAAASSRPVDAAPEPTATHRATASNASGANASANASSTNADASKVDASNADCAAWADRLDAHPDYRVLRRLVPRLDFGPPTVLATAGGAAWGAEASAPPGGPAPDDRWRTLLVLDTETTGLEAGRDRVIELALLRVTVDRTTGQPVGAVQVYDGLEDPGQPLPAAIVEITGLTDDQLRGQRLDDERVAELMRGVDLVVAHNAAFDRPFVERRYPAFAELAWACSWADLNWKAQGQGSAKLEALAAAAGWFYDAHRAEADCHALLAVLTRPLAAWRKPASAAALPPATLQTPAEAATNSLALLLEQAARTQYRLQATGAPFEAKDALKARGYRWDGGQRVWATVLRTEDALTEELAWLADAVYGGRATRVRVEALDARLRYAQRPGDAEMRPVGVLQGFHLAPTGGAG